MASVIGKRKREGADKANSNAKKKAAVGGHVNGKTLQPNNRSKGDIVAEKHENAKSKSTTTTTTKAATNGDNISSDPSVNVQIVLGSYERILHGIAAAIPASLLEEQSSTVSKEDATKQDHQVSFSDTFLFAAHSSSIRCIAVSPQTENDKRILATGSSDERINVYSVSTTASEPRDKTSAVKLAGNNIAENARNRSLGSLIHHDRAITRLAFPAKGKLFSAAEDNTVAISRTRDWTLLSSIKAPIPKPQGRPSGDTAAPGEVPAGINDFAIHPSQKLMLTVSKGEKCMRLWNLMTGKKAGVLTFDRDLLAQVGEGKFSSGEGRSILWDAEGENFVVAFEKGAVVLGIDSKPRAVIKPPVTTKFHRMRYLPGSSSILAIAAENGSILFFDTKSLPEPHETDSLPKCNLLGEVGGKAVGISGRVKDFSVLELPNSSMLVIAGSSDGVVRLWYIGAELLGAMQAAQGTASLPGQVGVLIGSIDAAKRITCLETFVLDGQQSADRPEDAVSASMDEEDTSNSDDSE